MTEQEAEKLGRGKLIREAAGAMLPLYARMREDVITKIIQAHRDPTQQGMLPSYAAELSVLAELTAKVRRSNTETNLLEEKLYGHE